MTAEQQATAFAASTVGSLAVNPYTQREFSSFTTNERCGTGRGEVISLVVLDEKGDKLGLLMPQEKFSIAIECVAHSDIVSPVIGVQMFDRLRTPIVGWNTPQYNYYPQPLSKGDHVCVSFDMCWPYLKSDNYVLEVALADGSLLAVWAGH